jgi:hypothetical protein
METPMKSESDCAVTDRVLDPSGASMWKANAWGVRWGDSHREALPDEEEINREFRRLANAFKALLKHV